VPGGRNAVHGRSRHGRRRVHRPANQRRELRSVRESLRSGGRLQRGRVRGRMRRRARPLRRHLRRSLERQEQLRILRADVRRQSGLQWRQLRVSRGDDRLRGRLRKPDHERGQLRSLRRRVRSGPLVRRRHLPVASPCTRCSEERRAWRPYSISSRVKSDKTPRARSFSGEGPRKTNKTRPWPNSGQTLRADPDRTSRERKRLTEARGWFSHCPNFVGRLPPLLGTSRAARIV
jgi:hypothetical protein